MTGRRPVELVGPAPQSKQGPSRPEQPAYHHQRGQGDPFKNSTTAIPPLHGLNSARRDSLGKANSASKLPPKQTTILASRGAAVTKLEIQADFDTQQTQRGGNLTSTHGKASSLKKSPSVRRNASRIGTVTAVSGTSVTHAGSKHKRRNYTNGAHHSGTSPTKPIEAPRLHKKKSLQHPQRVHERSARKSHCEGSTRQGQFAISLGSTLQQKHSQQASQLGAPHPARQLVLSQPTSRTEQQSIHSASQQATLSSLKIQGEKHFATGPRKHQPNGQQMTPLDCHAHMSQEAQSARKRHLQGSSDVHQKFASNTDQKVRPPRPLTAAIRVKRFSVHGSESQTNQQTLRNPCNNEGVEEAEQPLQWRPLASNGDSSSRASACHMNQLSVRIQARQKPDSQANSQLNMIQAAVDKAQILRLNQMDTGTFEIDSSETLSPEDWAAQDQTVTINNQLLLEKQVAHCSESKTTQQSERPSLISSRDHSDNIGSSQHKTQTQAASHLTEHTIEGQVEPDLNHKNQQANYFSEVQIQNQNQKLGSQIVEKETPSGNQQHTVVVGQENSDQLQMIITQNQAAGGGPGSSFKAQKAHSSTSLPTGQSAMNQDPMVRTALPPRFQNNVPASRSQNGGLSDNQSMANHNANPSPQQYYVVDGQNRLILVSPPHGASFQVGDYHHQYPQAVLAQQPQNLALQGHQETSSFAPRAQNATGSNQNRAPIYGSIRSGAIFDQPSHVVEQLSGKAGTVGSLTASDKRKQGSKATRARKENDFYQAATPHASGVRQVPTEGLVVGTASIQGLAEELVGQVAQGTKGPFQKSNRNSNQNMKTVQGGSGVSKRSSLPNQTPQASVSAYSTLTPGGIHQSLPAQGVILHVDQHGNYFVQQPGGPPQLVSAQQLRQLGLLHQQQRQSHGHAEQQQYSTNVVQQSHQSTASSRSGANSRPRPRSSAPAAALAANAKKLRAASHVASVSREPLHRMAHQAQPVHQEAVQGEAHVTLNNAMAASSNEAQAQARHIYNEASLMQATGHLIVKNVNGIPFTEIQAPMIINQSNGLVQGSHVFAQPQQSQPQGVELEGKAQSSTSTGFFGKRKIRDTKMGSTTSVKSSVSGPQGQQVSQHSSGQIVHSLAINNHQQAIVKHPNASVTKGKLLQRESIAASTANHTIAGTVDIVSRQTSDVTGQSSGSRPLTSKNIHGTKSTFHKTTTSSVSIDSNSGMGFNQSGKSHGRMLRQPEPRGSSKRTHIAVAPLNGATNFDERIILANGESETENQGRLTNNQDSFKGMSIFAGPKHRSSVVTGANGSQILAANGAQRGLASVRSGQLANSKQSVSSEGQPPLNQLAHQQAMQVASGGDLVLSKQHSSQDKSKSSAAQSPSLTTKISIRGRKGLGSIPGAGSFATGAGAGTNCGLQMLPSTPKTYKRTKRVLFARRMNLMDRPLLVITFQGVIGDFIKKPTQPGMKIVDVSVPAPPNQTNKEKKALAKEEDTVNLRAGALEGLKYLSQHFQLVIFSRETIEDSWYQAKGGQQPASQVQTKAILNLLSLNPEIKVDGFYASILSAKNQALTDDYSQIFNDFGLNSEQKVQEKVLFVNSIANDFICNQRLPASGNLSPKGKKPSAAQLGISNARGLQGVDPYGYFIFDTSCQPAQPLVKGMPISLDMKQHKKAASISGRNSTVNVAATSESNNEDTQPSTANGAAAEESEVTRHEMPSTLLVPNLRAQNVKMQTNFSHVLKSIMMLALLGQKKAGAKHLLKDNSQKEDLSGQLQELESEFGTIREKQVKLTQQQLTIMPQLVRGQTDCASLGGNLYVSSSMGPTSSQAFVSQKTSVPRRGARLSQSRGGPSTSSGPGGGLMREAAESPSGSEISLGGRNGGRGRVLKQHASSSGKQPSSQNQLLHISKMHQAVTSSSRTAATTHLGQEENSSSHSGGRAPVQLRSSSTNSDKGGLLRGGTVDAAVRGSPHLISNESCPVVDGQGLSPRGGVGTEFASEVSKEIAIDLTDSHFFMNLSWGQGVDYLCTKTMAAQKKFLGMQGASSDLVWRFYRKSAQERIKLRQIYETKMQTAEPLVQKALSNETIVANQQKNIDTIFKLFRASDLVGNPFGFTMGRNYRFFVDLKVQWRRRLSRELEQWKARNEAAAAALNRAKEPATSEAKTVAEQSPAEALSAEAKELAEAERFNSIIEQQQELQQQQHEALEELLDKNKLINRLVVVGLDAPCAKQS